MPTVRITNSGGQGYTDITTNNQGDVIGTTNYNENMVITEHTETDPETGVSSRTTYINDKPDVRETTDKGGEIIQRDLYNDKGQVVDSTTYDNENFTQERKTYDYDENGRKRVAK